MFPSVSGIDGCRRPLDDDWIAIWREPDPAHSRIERQVYDHVFRKFVYAVRSVVGEGRRFFPDMHPVEPQKGHAVAVPDGLDNVTLTRLSATIRNPTPLSRYISSRAFSLRWGRTVSGTRCGRTAVDVSEFCNSSEFDRLVLHPPVSSVDFKTLPVSLSRRYSE